MNRRANDKGKLIDASELVRRQRVWLLIDGYNLMHVTQFKPIRQDVGELRRCREGLLSLLASRLSPTQYRQVTVVFDATHAPSHLEARVQFKHITALFARDENSADDLIAKLVQDHTSAKQLIVVSSDHRVQNSAKRRKATVVDSELWFDALLDFRPRDENEVEAAHPKFELDDEQLAEFTRDMTQPEEESQRQGEPKSTEKADIENPFPEGYFDDLDEPYQP